MRGVKMNYLLEISGIENAFIGNDRGADIAFDLGQAGDIVARCWLLDSKNAVLFYALYKLNSGGNVIGTVGVYFQLKVIS
ncbi:hypothetical protein AO353_24265 [Pseudomonas fluorescens]|uniref:Uncharacterized protein n=1 Tax=Pseudomonas fluorescens TaxID=294 RepID=A0A0N9VTY8_PSEFL|nr:hypothetical protein AO353_24265 [Pseudomonas fluorescens]